MANKQKVLISAPYFQLVLDQYRSYFETYNIEIVVPEVHERLEEDELLSLVGDIDGVICGDDRFTERVFEAAPKLKIVAKWGTGIDSINTEAAKKYGVIVANTPNAFTEPVADTVMGYILCFARNIASMDKEMKTGKWEKIPGVSLSESTLGIIGFGNIGKAVAKRAHAFGMRILANDVKKIPKEIAQALNTTMVSLDKLLRESNFITTHCDLNPTSLHLLNAEAFARMRETTYVINTARGPIIYERALESALQNKKIAGAALDVFEDEPLSAKSSLRKLNTLLAPHNSNSSPRAWQNVHESTLRQLMEVLQK